VTVGILRSLFAAVPLAAALLLFSFAATADTLSASLTFRAPFGGYGLGFGPALYGEGSGGWSISSDLVAGLPNLGSINLTAADLTVFNFSIYADLLFENGSNAPTSLGQQSLFRYTLADLASFSAPVQRQGNVFVTQGFTITTNKISGSNPAFGVGSFSGPSNSSAAAVFSITGTSFSGIRETSFATFGGMTRGFNNDGTTGYVETTTREPASFLLAAPALAGLWFMRRKKAA
jgi:hypothetical protein